MPSPSASAVTTKPVDQAATQTTASAEQVTTVDTTIASVAAPVDVSAQVTAAVAAENSRIMGILNCDEAKGRESQARALAETPGMTVERTAHSGCCTAKCPGAYRYGAGSFDGNSTRCTPSR